MRALLLVLALICLPFDARAADPDLSRVPTETLIDQLADLETVAPGLSGWGTYDGFIGDDSGGVQMGLMSARVNGQVVAPPRAGIPPAMRELVRRGVDALPALLAHLDDARPTRLKVGGSVMDRGMFMSQGFGTEYHPRRSDGPRGCSFVCRFFDGTAPEIPSQGEAEAFGDGYTVRVGDVCFALVGQIVGRSLSAVRYQPTANLIVNSPVHRPQLVEWTRNDWSGLTRDGHRASLMADVVARKGRGSMADEALARLRFYYPETYARLAGEHGEAKAAFEKTERAEAARRPAG